MTHYINPYCSHPGSAVINASTYRHHLPNEVNCIGGRSQSRSSFLYREGPSGNFCLIELGRWHTGRLNAADFVYQIHEDPT